MSANIEVLLPGSRASSYPIWIGSGCLDTVASLIPKNKSTIVLMTDRTVKKYYALALEQSIKKAGHKTLLLSFPAGEKSKQIRTKLRLEEKMLAYGCDRDTLILAVGGGVVGDLAGFIAATYMRGIAYIQIPTTLLAMLDSSVGGKTGIDTPHGKNLIGAFWQPIAVVSDVNCLRTLSKKQMINGLIEAVKVFLTSDRGGLGFLEENLDIIISGDTPSSRAQRGISIEKHNAILAEIPLCARDDGWLRNDKLTNLVHRAVKIKATIVASDEREQHQRAILNFGHTIGHAIELLSQYQVLHGYAVALGILVESKIAQLLGHLSAEHYAFIKTLLQQLDITANELKPYDVDALIQATQLDKKKRAGQVHYVLLTGLGSVYEHQGHFAHPVSDDVVKRAYFEILGE
ncbi:MAG: 3-dehydroquinate synthase [Gammaproteobacteria bacterium]|nr:3-dehydroquinate synthase [Gammaproteobacteria bacterium]